MHSLQVFDPSGATEITRLHAHRLDSLEGKTIAIHSNDIWQAHRTLPLLRQLLEERFPSSTIITDADLPEVAGRRDADAMIEAFQAQGVNAVIVGNAA